MYTVYTTSYILYTLWLCNVYLCFMVGGINLVAKRRYFVMYNNIKMLGMINIHWHKGGWMNIITIM